MQKLVDAVKNGYDKEQNICSQSVSAVAASTQRIVPVEIRGLYAANIHADTE